jgi:hypothetical protein
LQIEIAGRNGLRRFNHLARDLKVVHSICVRVSQFCWTPFPQKEDRAKESGFCAAVPCKPLQKSVNWRSAFRCVNVPNRGCNPKNNRTNNKMTEPLETTITARSILYGVCVTIGLLMSWFDGVPRLAIAQTALIASVLLFALLVGEAAVPKYRAITKRRNRL